MLNRPAWKQIATERPGEDEARRVEQRVADAFEIAERAKDEALDGFERILADRQHDETGDDEGGGDIDERDERDVRPGGQGLQRRAHAARSLDARHQEAEVLGVGLFRPALAGDAAAAEHDDAVGEREDLVEFDRDQEHRLAGVALRDDPLVDEFDRADVDAAGRLPDEQDLGIAFDLARQHELLLIAAGEIGGLEQRRARPDVEGLHLLVGVGDDRLAVIEETLAVNRLAMKPEHRALAGFERHDEPDAMAIFRHVPDAEQPLHMRIALLRRDRLAFDQNFA